VCCAFFLSAIDIPPVVPYGDVTLGFVPVGGTISRSSHGAIAIVGQLQKRASP